LKFGRSGCTFYYISVARDIGRYSRFFYALFRGCVVVIVKYVKCSAYIRSIFRQGQRLSSETVVVNDIMDRIMRPQGSGC